MPDLIPFAPPPGLVSDDTSFSAQGRWADGSNVRFVEGKPETIGGWSQIITGLAVSITDMMGFTHAGSVYAAYAGGWKLYAGLGLDAPDDVTPAALTSDDTAPNWSLAAWGSTLLASQRLGKLYEMPVPGVAATAVSAAPAQMMCMLVTPERQVLAFGCNDEGSGTLNPACIRGSDLEDYTNWTTTASDNVFEHILDDGAEILAAALVGAYVGVWTTAGLWMGQFIGDPGQTYRFDRIEVGAGIAATGAVAVNKGIAYWVGADLNFYRWMPGGQPQIVPCPIWKDFRDNLTSPGSIRVEINSAYDEVWFLYPDNRDSPGVNCSRYLAFAIDASMGSVVQAGAPVWFRGALARDSMLPPGPLAQLLGSGTLMGDTAGNIWRHEIAASAPDAWFIQSADQVLDEGDTRMMIRGVVPDFNTQSGDVALTLTMRDRPRSEAVTKGPYTIGDTAAKVDFRASGRVASVRFSGTATYARFGTPSFDMVTMGER